MLLSRSTDLRSPSCGSAGPRGRLLRGLRRAKCQGSPGSLLEVRGRVPAAASFLSVAGLRAGRFTTRLLAPVDSAQRPHGAPAILSREVPRTPSGDDDSDEVHWVFGNVRRMPAEVERRVNDFLRTTGRGTIERCVIIDLFVDMARERRS